MGLVEAKLTVKKDEAPSSPPNSMEVVNGELASLKLQEKPAAGVGAPEIAAPADDAGLLDQDPESPRKGEEEASEKGVWPGFPQRPDEPDCAFYMKTGTCKFGLNCKFNHPPKRRRNRAKSKKQPEDVQAAKEVYVGSGTKLMGQPTRKVVEKEKKIAQKCFRHENVEVKQKGKPLKKVEKTEKKAVEEQKQTPCKRMEQEDYKAKLKKQWKVVQNGEENLKGILLKTVEQTEKKVVEEKQTLPKMAEQEDNNAVVEKQNISEKMERQDIKAAKEKCKETTSGKVGLAECKFYTMPGGWKYGKSCKFVHSQKKIEAGSLELNFLGLPIRPVEKECPFYMRTGNCKFSTNCKYHHPDPTVAIVGQDPLSGYQDSAPTQQIAFGASPLPVTPCPTQGTFGGPTFIVASPSYPPESILHSQRFHSNSECNGYQVNIDEHPERPGQPECHHFMKNGVCRFGSACKFHHPKVHLPFPTNSIGTFIPNYPSQ